MTRLSLVARVLGGRFPGERGRIRKAKPALNRFLARVSGNTAESGRVYWFRGDQSMSTLHHTTMREAVSHPDVVNLHVLERSLSAAGGMLLTLSGVRRGFREGKFRMLLGAEMLRRGFTGHSFAYQALGIRTVPKSGNTSVPYELGVHVRTSLTIGKPRQEVFAFWRDFSNLPKAMRHLIAVEQRDGTSHWTVEGPFGKRLQWDARIIDDVQDERIAWRSLPGSQVDSAGTVRFTDAPRGLGTEVHIELQYNPPAGYLGAYGAKLFGRDARASIESDCFRLKQFLETGEVATSEGQPKGPADSESRRKHCQTRTAGRETQQ